MKKTIVDNIQKLITESELVLVIVDNNVHILKNRNCISHTELIKKIDTIAVSDYLHLTN